MWGKALASIVIGAAIVLGLGANAAQAEETGWNFVTPNGAFLPILTREDGSQYWEVQIHGSGSYIASWEKKSGVWSDSNIMFSEALSTRECYTQIFGSYINRFGSQAEFRAAPTTVILTDDGNNQTWEIQNDPEVDAARAACKEASQWDYDHVQKSQNPDTGVTTVQIPLDQMGPGFHQLLLQNLSYPPEARGNPQCINREWGDGSWTGGGCLFEMGELYKIGVNVQYPMADNGTVLAGPKVSPKSWVDQSVYSNLEPVNFSLWDNFSKLIGPIGATLGITTVFAVLIALPTSLLESSLEANHDRVQAGLNRLIPWRNKSNRRKVPEPILDESEGEK